MGWGSSERGGGRRPKTRSIVTDGVVTGVSYKWFASVAGLPNLYSVIDGWCTLKVENNFYTENTFYKKQAVPPRFYNKIIFFHCLFNVSLGSTNRKVRFFCCCKLKIIFNCYNNIIILYYYIILYIYNCII